MGLPFASGGGLLQRIIILTMNIEQYSVDKEGTHYYMLFNEQETVVETKIELSAKGIQWWLDEINAKTTQVQQNSNVVFQPHELKILMVEE